MPKCTAEKPLYCGNKYWNVQKNVGEQQEVKTLYYKVMYWKVLVRPRLRGLVGPREAVLYCVAMLWGFRFKWLLPLAEGHHGRRLE